MCDISEFVGQELNVTVTRRWPSQGNICGYVLSASDDWVLLHVFHDFYPEGYQIIRTADIVDVRNGIHELSWHLMLGADGLLEGLRKPPVVELESVQALLRSVSARNRFMIVECEDKSEDIQDFYIGELCSASFDEVSFRHFDSLGRWQAELAVVDPSEITRVQFDCPYINHYLNHIDVSKYHQGKW